MARNLSIIAFNVALLLVTPAGAHTILGHWCHPDGKRELIVKGVDDVKLDGKDVSADVDQHHLNLVVPPGQRDAGARLRANQITDQEIRITVGSKPTQIWRTCKPVS